VISIHCGSRGLGHQIGSEFLQEMASKASSHGIALRTASWPARLFARSSANPISEPCVQESTVRSRTDRSSRTWFARACRSAPQRAWKWFTTSLTTRARKRSIASKAKRDIFGSTAKARHARWHRNIPISERIAPVRTTGAHRGTMGTASYVLAGIATSEQRAFSSACHGAGRRMSRIKPHANGADASWC